MNAKRVMKLVIVCSLIMVLGGMIGITSATASAVNDTLAEEQNFNQVKEYEIEITYLFTNVIKENESSGKYDIDREALKNTPFNYSEEEQLDITHFVYLLNTDEVENTDFSGQRVKRSWWDTVTGCVADAAGIGRNVIFASGLASKVKNKDFVAAAQILGNLAAKASGPITFVTALGFFWGCGAPKAS